MFILKPLADRRIALLWGAQVLSATGTEFYMVAVIWIAAALIGRDAGYVSALQSGALLFGSLFAGVLTDRWRHGTTMVGVSLFRAALLLLLAAAGALGFMSLPLLAVTAGLVALATSVNDPALQATLPMLTPGVATRHAVNSLFDATRRMARILGPSLIALVNGIVPIGQFFIITASALLLSALGVKAALRDTPLPMPEKSLGWPAAIDAVIGGARAVRHHRLMHFGLVAVLIGNLTWGMGLLLGMALHLRATSAEPLTAYGLMMSAYGVGNLGCSIVLAGITPKRPLLWIVTSKLTFGLGILLMPFAPNATLLMACAAFAAINGPFENLAMLHIMQHDFPPQRIAQVYRLQMCATFGGSLIGYLVAPTLFAAFGLAPMIATLGALTFSTGLIGLALRRRLQTGPAPK